MYWKPLDAKVLRINYRDLLLYMIYFTNVLKKKQILFGLTLNRLIIVSFRAKRKYKSAMQFQSEKRRQFLPGKN